MNARIRIPKDVVAKFCQRHQIRRLALLRDSITHERDVDVLVEFAPGCKGGVLSLGPN